ncbi:MAG: hypothetical protein AAGF11_38805 [Myxococcota bacterium]
MTSDQRAALRPGRWGALLSMLVLGACGAPVSLDTRPASSSSTATSTSDATDDRTSSGLGSTTSPTSTDLPGVDLPGPGRPGTCPEDCELTLSEAWSWEEGPDDLDPPPTERQISATIRAPNDALVVAENHDGVPWLTRISDAGVVLFSRSIAELDGCNFGQGCEVTDLSITESGRLIVVAQSDITPDLSALHIGQFDLFLATFYWTNWFPLAAYVPDQRPRVGSTFVIDSTRNGVLVVESNEFGNPFTTEALELFIIEESFGLTRVFIDSQPYGDRAWQPWGAMTDDGGIAVALTDTTGARDQGYLVWLDPLDQQPVEVEPLPRPADLVTRGSGYDVLTVGHAAVSQQQVSVYVSRAQPGLPLDWVHTAALPSTSASVPALTIDSAGRAIVATRVTGTEPEDTAIVLSRLDLSGKPEWTTTFPLATDPSERPVFVDADSTDALMLSTLVQGRLHVAKYQQDCRCE